MFNNKSILVTGGTGSFGKAWVSHLLSKYKKIKRLIIFSRDELKQYEMEKTFSFNKYPCLRYFIGDVRDSERLVTAFMDIDYIIHAAALKQVPTAEYNPIETIKTNIIGAQNVIEASLKTGVKKVLALSTDKASSPINLYGATKLCSDKLFIAANNIKGKKNISFSIVRYGNVTGSRGSVIPHFQNTKRQGFLEITDKRMTRFNITLKESIEMVDWAFKNSIGGEILVPKIPSYKILDLAKAISPNCKLRFTGIRPGEKLHEELLNSGESLNTYETKNYYIILPSDQKKYKNFYEKKLKAKKVKKGFTFRSDQNTFLSLTQLKNLLKNY
jgi:UDP-N-acetylglucosamine 4,6-dehydratase/5-epimerase